MHRASAAALAASTAALLAVAALAAATLATHGCAGPAATPPGADPPALRLALFNVRELSAGKIADVDAAGAGRDPQLRAAAAIVQRVRPDVLVLQEIDGPTAATEAPARHARRFAELYLATGDAPIHYPHAFAAPVNTGILSGFDLNGDGTVATTDDLGTRTYGDDCWGWGTYPGQYGMAVLSRRPLAAAEARTFRTLRWRDLPGNHLPPGFYTPEELAGLPLSSKSHWDLPVEVAPGRRLHLWISHPTPPVFDGDEDRNGRRNFDEIRLWRLYLDGSDALVDDAGRRGGASAGAPFVVVGDLNADPGSPEAVYDGVQAVEQLLRHPAIGDPAEVLVSDGARALQRIGGRPPERATADFEPAMRLDYLLPAAALEVVGGGVFWPAADTDPEGHRLATEASDHRLLWLDLRLR